MNSSLSNVVAPTQQEIPQAEASAQLTEEHASTVDENQAAEENSSTRADDRIPAADDIAMVTTSVAPEEIVMAAEASTAVPEETDHARAAASVVPEENEPISFAPPAPTPSPILPSASDAKKTKAAERAAVKKRKTSASSESSTPKKAKTLTRSYENPIDDVPVSGMPSKEIVPFGEEYEFASESDEEDPSAASSEQVDEEIEVEGSIAYPLLEVFSSALCCFYDPKLLPGLQRSSFWSDITVIVGQGAEYIYDTIFSDAGNTNESELIILVEADSRWEAECQRIKDDVAFLKTHFKDKIAIGELKEKYMRMDIFA